MTFSFRLRMQLAEILGADNRYFCSKHYGRQVNDPDLLTAYFCKNGGAIDFARRFNEAMGPDNRWYCSEFHGRDIADPVILWRYYMTHRNGGTRKSPPDRNKAC